MMSLSEKYQRLIDGLETEVGLKDARIEIYNYTLFFHIYFKKDPNILPKIEKFFKKVKRKPIYFGKKWWPEWHEKEVTHYYIAAHPTLDTEVIPGYNKEVYMSELVNLLDYIARLKDLKKD